MAISVDLYYPINTAFYLQLTHPAFIETWAVLAVIPQCLGAFLAVILALRCVVLSACLVSVSAFVSRFCLCQCTVFIVSCRSLSSVLCLHTSSPACDPAFFTDFELTEFLLLNNVHFIRKGRFACYYHKFTLTCRAVN